MCVAEKDKYLLCSLSRNPFIDAGELAAVEGRSPATVHRGLTRLRAAGIVGRVQHATAHLPASWRYWLTVSGIDEACALLGHRTRGAYLRAYPMSREWLRLLIGRMDATASIYRIAAALSPGSGGRRTRVTFHTGEDYDAIVELHNTRTIGIVRQGLALTRASLRYRIRRIYRADYSQSPGMLVILTPSEWERNLAADYWASGFGGHGYVGAESEAALTRRDLPEWSRIDSVIGGKDTLAAIGKEARPTPELVTSSPTRTRASMPDPDEMVRAASTFGLSQAEKRLLDIVTCHPMIPRAHLVQWLDVSGGRVSQLIHSLSGWDLLEARVCKGAVRYTLPAAGREYIRARDRTTTASVREGWSTDPRPRPMKKRQFVGKLINRWFAQTAHTDGSTAVLSMLAGESTAAAKAAAEGTAADTDAPSGPSHALLWWTPEWRGLRIYHWRERSITPDAVGEMVVDGAHLPFLLEYERTARYPKGIARRLAPYKLYYGSPHTEGDLPPFPYTLFVVDSEAVAETYVTTAARMDLSLPILVSSMPALADRGALGRSWHPLWAPKGAGIRLEELAGHHWHRGMVRR